MSLFLGTALIVVNNCVCAPGDIGQLISMGTVTKKIDTDSLRVGMYVSSLDRPWLETSFLFQGFCIRTQDEIEEIRRYCNYVVVDINQSSEVLDDSALSVVPSTRDNLKPDQKSVRSASFSQGPARFFRRNKNRTVVAPKPGEFYEDTASVNEELETAKGLYTDSLDKVARILDGIRQGNIIKVPELDAVAGSLVDSVLRNSAALALLARMQKKGDYIHAQSISSSIWALVFGRHLGLDRESLNIVGLGGLLLDVGKTKLPRELLTKPGKLTDVELALARNHVQLGLQLIKKAEGVDQRVIDMVATHHERADGSGYPNGLKGSQIPVFGRIGGIVDSYAAMTGETPYAPALSTYNAMRELKSLANQSFQSEMVEQFIQAVGIFPAGTLVELSSGEIGIVIKEHKFHRLEPEIALIFDADKKPLAEFRVIDLHVESESSGASLQIWIERGVEPGEYDIDPTEYFL